MDDCYYSNIGGDIVRDFKGFYGENTGIVNQYIITRQSASEIQKKKLIRGSPYLGLKKFASEDKDKFFGREQLVTKLGQDLEENHSLLLLGASGSGKSSLVQAGIIPYLADEWGVSKLERFTCVPDINPFASLYNCLPNQYKIKSNPLGKENPNPNNNRQLIEFIDNFKKSSHRWIIFIDQFEEIFTSTSSKPKRDGFIANLVALMRKHYSSVKLILAMRSDFIDNLREYGDLSNEIESKIRLMRELTESELRLAIAEPAARNGVTFEPGLVEQIMRDFHQQAGSLPLLQYTLDLLWEKDRIGPEKRILQLETYENLGGVSGALEKQANEIYQQQLNHEEKKAAAKIFIQLIDLIDLGEKNQLVEE